jgi:hydroxypyruvate reductase
LDSRPSNLPDARTLLLRLYRAGLDAVAGEAVVRDHLGAHPIAGPVALVAIGKASVAMGEGAFAALGDQIQHALIITKRGDRPSIAFDQRCDFLQSDHPVPSAASLAAGEALLRFCHEHQGPKLVLISGGASALVEVPIEGVDLETLERINRWLLGSGLDIHSMNHLRKSVSRIKGGRLAAYMGSAPVKVLAISDVRGDTPGAIGSGLLVPSDVDDLALPDALPDWLAELYRKREPMPDLASGLFDQIEFSIVARLDDALRAVAAAAVGQGLRVHRAQTFVGGDAHREGQRMARTLIAGEPGLYIWGGEPTVELPETPGRGGRCQAAALAAAQLLQGSTDIALLCAGTDGSDGPNEDAGALVDGGTIARGSEQGREAADSLLRADAGTFLEASGDLIETGPTGTNVTDLFIGYKSA